MFKKALFISGAVFVSLILTSCCSSGKMVKEKGNSDTPPYKAALPLPPGNADIHVTILDVTETEEDIVSKAKVVEVTGYGASTPPLPIGEEIEIHFTKQSVKDFTVEKNSQLYLRASHFNQQGDENDYWAFVQLNKE